MQILLEEFYKLDLQVEKFHERKIYISHESCQINGISQSGKTKLIKNYLLSLKKNSYLYIDCNDVRIEYDELNKHLHSFCLENKIDVLALDNYNPKINFINVSQLLITSQIYYELDFMKHIYLFPLDYEEFLAYEHKYDSSALNHFLQLGGLPHMHKVPADQRVVYIQQFLKSALSEMEFDILKYCAKVTSQKISAFNIYERLKTNRKISKDKLYKEYENLLKKRYIHNLQKLNHKNATKKLYLCDISFKSALSTEKHFGRLFENMVFLELLKSNKSCFYDDGIDFYIPDAQEVILCMPFTDERSLFKKLEQIEAFIFTYQIKKVTAITMNKEGSLSHPFSKVEMLPFDIWALGD